MEAAVFLTICVSVCVYLWACIDDLKAIIACQADDIEQRISMQEQFIQFVKLHAQLYEYFIEYVRYTFGRFQFISIELNENVPHCLCRMMYR